MSDLTEELGRLADLRDRGVLTQQEFDQQKARLLRPKISDAEGAAPIGGLPSEAAVSSAPAAGATREVAALSTPGPPGFASATSGSKGPVFIIVGVVALIVIAVTLWASGVLRPAGLANRGTTPNASGLASDSKLLARTREPDAAATPIASSPPLPPPVDTPAREEGGNPLIGSWANDGAVSADCPAIISFKQDTVTMISRQNGSPVAREAAMSYRVTAPNTVVLASPDNAGITTTATVRDGHLSLSDGSCAFHRLG